MAINHRHVNASPEDVFDVLSNGWLYPSWVVGASRIRDVDDSWPAPQSNIHHSFGVWPLLINDTTSILEWDPPRRVVLKARGWPLGTAKVTLTVELDAIGCLIHLTEDVAEGPGLLVPKVVRDVGIHGRNNETLQRLGFLAEGHAD